MISETLQAKIQEAMKAGDAVRVSTLRLLSNAFHNEKIAKQRDLAEDEEMVLLRRQLKQREEAVDAYDKGGRPEAAQKERDEAAVLKEFMPEQMSEDEIGQIADKVIAELGKGDFGQVMGAVMKEVSGKADGKTVSSVVSGKLKE